MAKESRIARVDEFGCREWSEIGVGVNWDAILKKTLAIAFHINKKFEIHESIKQKLPNSNNQNYSIQIMARINELIINPFELFSILHYFPIQYSFLIFSNSYTYLLK